MKHSIFMVVPFPIHGRMKVEISKNTREKRVFLVPTDTWNRFSGIDQMAL